MLYGSYSSYSNSRLLLAAMLQLAPTTGQPEDSKTPFYRHQYQDPYSQHHSPERSPPLRSITQPFLDLLAVICNANRGLGTPANTSRAWSFLLQSQSLHRYRGAKMDHLAWSACRLLQWPACSICKTRGPIKYCGDGSKAKWLLAIPLNGTWT
jgi:hypothetical protein